MDLSSLKEDLSEKVSAVWEKIQEQPAYSQLLEAYDSLPVNAQKGVTVTSTIIGIYLVFSIPLSFLSSSQESTEEFNSNRQTIRELLKTTRLKTGSSSFRSGPVATGLNSRVRSTISSQNFLPEQIGEIKTIDVSSLSLGPKTIEKFGVEAKIKSLNIKEVISLGYQLQQVTSGVKLIGMDMIASKKDPHYFDVAFRLVSFVLPPEEVEVTSSKKGKRRRRPLNRKGSK